MDDALGSHRKSCMDSFHSCASLANLSLGSENLKQQIPLLVDFISSDSKSSLDDTDCNTDTKLLIATDEKIGGSRNMIGFRDNIIPKDLAMLKSEAFEIGLIAYADGLNDSDGSAVVELNPVRLENQDLSAEDIARLLAYLHYIHHKYVAEFFAEKVLKRKQSGSLSVIVDCRYLNNREEVDICFLALSHLLKWVSGSVKHVFGIVPHNQEGKKIMEESGNWINSEMNSALKVELITMENLHKEIAGNQLTKELGGERIPHGSDWVEFRKALDVFLKNCRALGEMFVDLNRDMRRTNGTATELWEMYAVDLEDYSWSLRKKLNHIQSSDHFYLVRDEGEERLHILQTMFPNIIAVETHRLMVEKAAGLYREVWKIMGKASTSVDKRCRILEAFVQAQSFISQVNEFSKWIEEVALPTADRQEMEPSVSLMRLRLQERQYEQFLSTAKIRLESGERLLLDSEWLWNPGVDKLGNLSAENYAHHCQDEDNGNSPFTESQRLELKKIWTDLVDKLEMTDKRLLSVRDNLANSLICHHMLDKVYDWALHNAKWSSQLSLLISSACTASRNSYVSLEALLIEVRDQLDKYPTEELRQLPVYALRLADEKIQAQASTLTTRCTEAKQMLLSQKQRLEELQSCDNSGGRSCCGSTEYEEPIGRKLSDNSTTSHDYNQDDFTLGFFSRRRSFAGTPSTPLNAVAESYEYRYRPLYQDRGSSMGMDTIGSEGSASIREEDVAQGIITEDMTDQVVSTMSANTLKKKLAERKLASVDSTSKKVVPDPMPPPFQSCRVGSARCSKSRKPFRKLMKRSTTCDSLIKSDEKLQPQTVPDLHILPATPLKDSLRQASLASLTSIGEESVHSESMSSASAHSSGGGCPSFDAPPLPLASVVPCLEDDAGSSGSSREKSPSGNCISPAHFESLVCFRIGRLRQEEYRLDSPPPDASPDYKMQNMIINELLQTELNYVASLHYVINHYVPEMSREDLPQELRGQRYTIFGNLEKIYDFHVQLFLPQLKARIQRHSDSLGLEVARCFLDHRSKFHLYALYNKNKPKSDLLLSECGAVFFRTKQLLLNDKLDLASYLLKPVQRMGKYALLLHHLLTTCSPDDQETTETIRKAEEMVSFQLRHGNDLLAMDMIRGCDLNLKEQGQLLRQDEFVVSEAKGLHRKCLRRVFLFEHLVLFAKPRRGRGIYGSPSGVLADTYQYKHSIKMSDVGLTEKVKDSKLKFELWFRRHTASTTYCLQSHSETVRNAWVNDIARLLWSQAFKNRELRLAEMTSMGMGNKTCLDLKTSEENRIENRTVSSSLLNKVARFRNSFTAVTSHHSNFVLKSRATVPGGDAVNSEGNGNKRPHSLISVGSSSCSSNNSSLGTGAVHSHASAVLPSSSMNFFVPRNGTGGDLSALEEHPDDITSGAGSNASHGSRFEIKVVADGNPVTGVLTKENMGKVKLELKFSNQNGAFYAGQQVTGTVTTELTEATKIRADSSLTGECPVLEAGMHDFPFVFNSPRELPSSFESPNGYVRYWCKAYVHRPWKFDETTKKAFSVISLVDLNNEPLAFTAGYAHAERQFSLTDRLMCCVRGGLSVHVRTERRAFVPGEEILINAEITNNSTEKVNSVEAYIQQNVIYSAKSGSRFNKGETKIAQITHGAVVRGDVQVWPAESMIVPSLPPSKLGGCRLIHVDYLLNFVVHVGTAENIHLTIPIIIGTLPLHSQPLSWLPQTVDNPSMETQRSVPSAPPCTEPTAPEYIGPPPTYEECVHMDPGDIQDGEDNQYTGGDRTYRPLYPIYATLHR